MALQSDSLRDVPADLAILDHRKLMKLRERIGLVNASSDSSDWLADIVATHWHGLDCYGLVFRRDGYIEKWNLSEETRLWRVPFRGGATVAEMHFESSMVDTGALFDPSGNFCMVCPYEEGRAAVLNGHTGELLTIVGEDNLEEGGFGPNGYGRSADPRWEFSPDGQYIAQVSNDYAVKEFYLSVVDRKTETPFFLRQEINGRGRLEPGFRALFDLSG